MEVYVQVTMDTVYKQKELFLNETTHGLGLYQIYMHLDTV
jgi:hypothetical protein